MRYAVTTQLWKGALGFISIFLPREGYFVTPILINIHIGVFVVMWLYGVDTVHLEPQGLIQFGDKARPLIIEGQYCRLISGLFIHENIHSFLATIYYLFFMGIWFEKPIGTIKYGILYIVIAMVACLAGVYF